METTDKAVGLEIRSVEVRSVDESTRTIRGLAVPYGQETSVAGYKERFEKGAFGSPENVRLFYGHSEPIGLVTVGRDTDEGYEIEARISETPRGDEVYTLMRDKVLNTFSVGFLPVEHRMDKDVVVRTKAELKEVSVVAFPAYEGAKVSEVREDTQGNKNKEVHRDMNDEIKYAPESEVADLRDAFTDLERRFAVASEDKNDATPQYRNAGEWLKALAAGDREARDFGTTVEADVTRPGWVSESLKRKVENRPVINLFSKGALPASGNSIEYPYIKTDTGTVGEQVLEGDALAYMEVALDTATAPVKTYGGYVSLSRQAIERSDLAYLETSLGHMVNQYAKATEAAVRSALVAATGTGTALLAADTSEAWIDVVVDSAAAIEADGTGAAEFALVSLDVFKRISHMVDGAGRPLFAVSGQGVNALGSTNIVVPRANIGGLPVVVDPALAANTMFVADSDALKTFESAGAPFRLQDENIINLTKDFSLYGYLAVAVLNAKNIVKVDVDLVA